MARQYLVSAAAAAAAVGGIKRSSSNPDDSNSIQSIQSNKIVKVAIIIYSKQTATIVRFNIMNIYHY